MSVLALATVIYGVSRPAPGPVQHTRAVCQHLLRGTGIALNSVCMGPAQMSFAQLLYTDCLFGTNKIHHHGIFCYFSFILFLIAAVASCLNVT